MTENKVTSTQRIAELNDQVRQSLLLPPNQKSSVPHRVMLTRGVSSLSLQDRLAIVRKVSEYGHFTSDNDPYGERDFGSFEHKGSQIFWKFGYYDSNLEYGSSEPEDPEKTVRVLTIMFSDEY